jgi:hypothetical protein
MPSPVNVLANSNNEYWIHYIFLSAPTGDEEQQVVEDKYVGLPSSEEARLRKLPSWSELLGTTKLVLVYLLQDNNVGLAGRYNGRAMQTAAETYGRAVDTIFVFDESKAKHDVNEVEESCAWWQAQR